jgi:O-antigen ligase
MGAVAILGVLWWAPQSRPPQYATMAGFAWVLFTAVNLAFRPQTPRFWESMRDIPLLLIPLAGILVSDQTIVRAKPTIKKYWWLGAAALAVVALRAIVQSLVWREPATGFMHNSIYFAYNLLPAFIFVSELSLNGKKSLRALALVLGLALVLSQNRMMWIVVLSYLIFRVLPVARKSVLIFVAIVAISIGLLPDFAEKLMRLTHLASDPSFTARLDLWAYNFDLFKSSPLFGVGFERNAMDPSQQLGEAGWKDGHLLFSHSIYLQALADGGLVGGFLFFSFWLALALRFPLLWPLMLSLGIAGLTENIFNNSRPMHAVYFYTLCTLLWARYQNIGRQKNDITT